ncbi:MAG TPA: hypothetical protein VMT59_05740 [Gaiellaceae bacterium]|nr:hypothetical protein [Gaiellaceae bacterium]
MDEARAVLARLERVEALGREAAPASALLAELRLLVREAEAWVRADRPGVDAEDAVARCAAAFEGRLIGTST